MVYFFNSIAKLIHSSLNNANIIIKMFAFVMILL